MSRHRQLGKQLSRVIKKTSERWQLLEPDDHVMVAISGGKDSYTMLVLLHELKARLPFDVKLTAVHLDQVQPGYNGKPLQDWLEASGYDFEILQENTYSVVVDKVKEGGTYCSLCSRLRRGILYTAAERLGCNKIALGHHREDTLETFLMNLFFSGKMQAMPAKYRTDDGRFEVIRPMIECAEEKIAEYAALSQFPILPCNLCGSQPKMQRDAMGDLMLEMEKKHPGVRSVMLNALGNIRPTHLLDRDVLGAWDVRPEDIRPKGESKPRAEHAAAKPIASKKRLPLA